MLLVMLLCCPRTTDHEVNIVTDSCMFVYVGVFMYVYVYVCI